MESRYMRRKRLETTLAHEIAQTVGSLISALSLIACDAPTWGWVGIAYVVYLLIGVRLAVKP
jgi:hypothetical protein